MSDLAAELAALPFLRSAGAFAIARSARYWQPLDLAVGQRLWEEGQPATSLAIVLHGELEVQVAGRAVGRVLAPELVGEAGVFFEGEQRSATLHAVRPTSIGALSAPGLAALRRDGSPVYDVLLDQALQTLARRIRAIDQRIALLAVGGTEAPARKEPSALVRMWRAIVPGGPAGEPPPLVGLLRAQPGLADADDTLLTALAAAYVPVGVTQGEVIFFEGDPGAALYVVGTGTVEVLRNVRGDRAELLATLGPGASFGANTLVEVGARTASCVASTAAWLYRLDRVALGRLPPEVRRVWRESMAASLAAQIRHANQALHKVMPQAPVESSFRGLLQASGFLEGLPTHEAQLETVRFAVDEDMRRNPRRRV